MTKATESRRKGAVMFLLAALAMTLMTCVGTRHVRPTPVGLDGFVTAENGDLRLNGGRYRFLGVNVYSLASAAPGSGDFICGNALTDDGVRDLFREVAAMGGNAVRIDAFQSFTAGGTDFSRLDLILDEARRRDIRVIMTLENQWPDCTEGGYKYADWYRAGYREPYGSYRLSYREYVSTIVGRYRDDPAILMWQLMNEAESKTVQDLDDPESLMAFVMDMAAVVNGIDRNHLLSIGTIGVARAGSGGAFYALLHQLPGIDLVEAHDYHADTQRMPRDVWLSLLTARMINRPFFIGEIGMDSPPLAPDERATLIGEKLEAAWHEEVDGVLVWSYCAGDGGNKDFDIHDPLAGTLRRFSRTHHVRPDLR